MPIARYVTQAMKEMIAPLAALATTLTQELIWDTVPFARAYTRVVLSAVASPPAPNAQRASRERYAIAVV